jgi:hypothetical protein
VVVLVVVEMLVAVVVLVVIKQAHSRYQMGQDMA